MAVFILLHAFNSWPQCFVYRVKGEREKGAETVKRMTVCPNLSIFFHVHCTVETSH